MSLILTAAMSFSLIACGANGENSQPKKETAESTADESSKETAENSADENGKETAESSADNSGSTLLCEEPTTLIVYGTWSESPTTEDDQLIHDKILEMTNVDLVRVGSSDYYNQRATYLSSGEQIDLMQESCWWATDLIAQGAYQDVTELVEEYAPNFFTMLDPGYHKFVQWDGKYYGIGGTNYMNLYGIWVNKTMLDEAGLEIPQTIEDLEKTCAALLEKDPDCYPIVANWMWLQREYESSFTEAYGDWYDSESGLLKVDFEMPGYIDFISTVREWYKNGYIAKFCEPGSFDDDKFASALMSGKCAFVSNNVLGFLDRVSQIEGQPEYVFTEAFEGKDGRRGFEPRPSIPYFFAVPSSSKNAELAIKFLNWAMTEDARRLMNHGIEGIHYTIDEDGYMVKTDAYDDYTKCYNLHDIFTSELKEKPATENDKITEDLLNEYGMNTYFSKNDSYGINMDISSIPQDLRDKQSSDRTAVSEVIAKYMWTDEADLDAVQKAISDYAEKNSEFTELRTEIYKNCLDLLGTTPDEIRAGLEKK